MACGLSAGWLEEEFRAVVGVDFATRGARLGRADRDPAWPVDRRAIRVPHGKHFDFERLINAACTHSAHSHLVWGREQGGIGDGPRCCATAGCGVDLHQETAASGSGGREAPNARRAGLDHKPFDFVIGLAEKQTAELTRELEDEGVTGMMTTRSLALPHPSLPERTLRISPSNAEPWKPMPNAPLSGSANDRSAKEAPEQGWIHSPRPAPRGRGFVLSASSVHAKRRTQLPARGARASPKTGLPCPRLPDRAPTCSRGSDAGERGASRSERRRGQGVGTAGEARHRRRPLLAEAEAPAAQSGAWARPGMHRVSGEKSPPRRRGRGE